MLVSKARRYASKRLQHSSMPCLLLTVVCTRAAAVQEASCATSCDFSWRLLLSCAVLCVVFSSAPPHGHMATAAEVYIPGSYCVRFIFI